MEINKQVKKIFSTFDSSTVGEQFDLILHKRMSSIEEKYLQNGFKVSFSFENYKGENFICLNSASKERLKFDRFLFGKTDLAAFNLFLMSFGYSGSHLSNYLHELIFELLEKAKNDCLYETESVENCEHIAILGKDEKNCFLIVKKESCSEIIKEYKVSDLISIIEDIKKKNI